MKRKKLLKTRHVDKTKKTPGKDSETETDTDEDYKPENNSCSNIRRLIDSDSEDVQPSAKRKKRLRNKNKVNISTFGSNEIPMSVKRKSNHKTSPMVYDNVIIASQKKNIDDCSLVFNNDKNMINSFDDMYEKNNIILPGIDVNQEKALGKETKAPEREDIAKLKKKESEMIESMKCHEEDICDDKDKSLKEKYVKDRQTAKKQISVLVSIILYFNIIVFIIYFLKFINSNST